MRSLRARLALTIFLIGGLALAAMSLAVERFVASDLVRRQDVQLRDAGTGFAEGRYRDVIDPGRNLERVLLPGVLAPSVEPPYRTGTAYRAGTSGSVSRRRFNPVGEIYTELRDDRDQLILEPRVFRLDDSPTLVLKLPATLPPPSADGVTFNVRSNGGDRYRALYRSLVSPDGRRLRLLTAIRSQNLFDTLRRLRFILTGASIGVLAAIGTASWFVARLGLRPLQRIETAASTIASGDLSHRVTDVDERSEIGRLGGSLNQMMSQIETAFDEREQSQEQLQRFVADASHELRTPLTAIRGHAQLQLRDRMLPAGAQAAFAQIESAGGRMTGIVENLLTLARNGRNRAVELAPVSLADVARSVVADAAVVHEDREIALSLPDGCDELLVLAEPDRLHQAIANLSENALRYTTGAVRVAVSAHDDQVLLQVSDDGPGIGPDHLPHLFEPFYRVDPGRARATGGSGLGLAIAKANTEAIGGTIGVVSDVVRGSTFTLCFPRHREADPPHA